MDGQHLVKSLMEKNDPCFPQHFDHPSNPISAAFAERLTVVVAVDSLVVCLTGLTIAEWNNQLLC